MMSVQLGHLTSWIMQNEKKIKRSLSSDSNQVVLKNSCPSLQLGVVTSPKLEMLCRLAARNQCLMFLQFHPSNVDTHGVNVDARGVIATVCNWDQIFMCYLPATAFFCQNDFRRNYLTLPCNSHIPIFIALYAKYSHSEPFILPKTFFFAALFNSVYFTRISSCYQKYFHTLPA